MENDLCVATFFFFLQVKWATIIKDDEAVAKHHLSTYTHAKFSLERREGTPNYNILVEEP